MRLGLTHKIFGGYLLLIGLLLAIGGYAGVTAYGLMGDYRTLVVEEAPAQRALDALIDVFHRQTASEKKYQVVPRPDIKALFETQLDEWQSLTDRLLSRYTNSRHGPALIVLLQEHQRYTDKVRQAMTSGSPADSDDLIVSISQNLLRLSENTHADQAAMLAATEERGDRILRLTIILALVILCAGLGGAWVLANLLTRPVRRLKAATHEVALGIFDQKVPVESADEIGDLAASFNRMAEKLASLDDLREEFIAYISHELKTPLYSLKEANALLLEGVAGELQPRQRQLLRIIGEDGEKIERLISELLELSKMEAGMMPFNMVDEPFNSVAQAALEELQPVAEQRGIHLQVSSEVGITVHVDPPRIRQVLTNLISNAIKFSPPGGTVQVDWKAVDNQLCCAVTDSGPGIPTDAREVIFEKFHQLNPSALSGMRGTGLGLPIARKIVEFHHGRLSVTCPDTGGSVFTFVLPFADPQYANLTGAAHVATTHPAG